MTQQSPPPIPAPTPQPESDFYFEKCKEGELWLRHCNACDSAYFYPRDICPGCFSRDTNWIQSSGKGTIHTFAIVHRGAYAPLPRPLSLRAGDRGIGGWAENTLEPGRVRTGPR